MIKNSIKKDHRNVRYSKKGLKTRERILAVATKMFARYGFAGTSMDDLSEKVGIKKASLYHHFPSKQDIYIELVDKVFSELIEIFHISFTSDDIEENAGIFLKRVMNYILKNQDYIRIFVRELLDENVPVKQISERYLPRLLEFSRDILKDGMRRGVVREGIDPIQLAFTLTGAIIIYFLFAPVIEPFIPNPLSKRAIEKRVRHIVDILMNGIRNRRKQK